jgi:viroplasmin and RNaseH domain-containing protein
MAKGKYYVVWVGKKPVYSQRGLNAKRRLAV